MFDPSKVLNGSSSDPLLWKDADGKIRFTVVRNMSVGDRQIGPTATWEFVMLDQESENTGWSAPRLVSKSNVSVMKPLVFPDGSVLRPGDNYSGWGNPKKAFFIKESRDGGKTWREVGFPLKVSIDTKAVLFRAKSGNLILVANDVPIAEMKDGKPVFGEVRGPDGKTFRPGGARYCMTAFISYDDGKTFPKKILLDERSTSYPSVCEYEGFLYIAYDHSRSEYKKQEILLAKITEADIEAGKLVTPGSELKMEISSPSKHGGGVRKDDTLL